MPMCYMLLKKIWQINFSCLILILNFYCGILSVASCPILQPTSDFSPGCRPQFYAVLASRWQHRIKGSPFVFPFSSGDPLQSHSSCSPMDKTHLGPHRVLMPQGELVGVLASHPPNRTTVEHTLHASQRSGWIVPNTFIFRFPPALLIHSCFWGHRLSK